MTNLSNRHEASERVARIAKAKSFEPPPFLRPSVTDPNALPSLRESRSGKAVAAVPGQKDGMETTDAAGELSAAEVRPWEAGNDPQSDAILDQPAVPGNEELALTRPSTSCGMSTIRNNDELLGLISMYRSAIGAFDPRKTGWVSEKEFWAVASMIDFGVPDETLALLVLEVSDDRRNVCYIKLLQRLASLRRALVRRGFDGVGEGLPYRAQTALGSSRPMTAVGWEGGAEGTHVL